MKVTEMTTEQRAAADLARIGSGSKAATPEAYAAEVLAAACVSWAAQYSSDTVSGLRAQLAAEKEARIAAEAKAQELQSKAIIGK